MSGTEANKSEIIEIIRAPLPSTALWLPYRGTEITELLEHLKAQRNLSLESQEKLQQEAALVLSKCLPPHEAANPRTGLIIGYVQSGKTMSFTTVSALARDNGFRLIILLSGVTVNLFKQSNERLESDLRLRQRPDRKWRFLTNPRNTHEARQSLEAVFSSGELLPGAERRTILISVMKNTTHMDHLINLLSNFSLETIPALIIDDEADQASLNNSLRRGGASATYTRIVSLRHILPHHTYLQYTATPQAPLLISLIDILSPDFSSLLTPGADYTGGEVFFERDLRKLIQRIPSDEIGTRQRPLLETPESLLKAMHIFYIGVAIGRMQGSLGNRSMMVHPSNEIMRHSDYVNWVRAARQSWLNILRTDEHDLDKHELLEDFKAAYNDLSRTINNLPQFEEIAHFLPIALSETVVVEVNTAGGRRTPQIEWDQEYAHIVVGGEVLSRGYTIEGLTVSYMPRGRGVANADTLQQRARWFGYKADYLGFCRVYLEDQMITAYQSYVEHERNIREQLNEHEKSGRSLREWRRAFLLSRVMQPTRSSVVTHDYVRGNYSNSWVIPHAPHALEKATEDNRLLVSQFVSGLNFQLDQGHSGRTEQQKHLVAEEVPLQRVYEDFLTQLRFARLSDGIRFYGLLLQIKQYLADHPDAVCSVYQMSQGRQRTRRITENDEIQQLFQGAFPTDTKTRGVVYPGDRYVGNGRNLSIQIHTLGLTTATGEVIANNVPAVAVWVPQCMAVDWLLQEQERLDS